MKTVTKKIFHNCEKCGKRLIERQNNGLWRFLFGRKNTEDGPIKYVIDMTIHGSIKMKCIRKTCDHINTLTFFPNNQSDSSENIR